MSAIKVSVSLQDDLLGQAKARATKMGYVKFSHYITYLVESDLLNRPDHEHVLSESGSATASNKHNPRALTLRKRR